MNRLQDEFSAQIVLMGSAGEAATSQEINALAGDRALDLTGKTSLADAAAIFTAVDLLISNDMGLAHVAPAVGTRTIVIFGPTDPLATRPFSTLAEVVRREVECSPCMLRDCPIDHRCMTRILPDDIFDRAQEILLSNDKLSITAAGGIRRS
jgi:heptosyltransferase-2